MTGASNGIGREFARELAAVGFSLILVARREVELDALSTELTSRHGVDCVVHAVDLSARDAVGILLDAVSDVDIGLLVAAAGYGTSGAFLEVDVPDELRMIDVNCRAVTELTHVFARRFAARGRGGVVLMSSLLAFQGVPRAATYAATKAFIQVLAEGVRRELNAHGVDVIAVAPGPIRSGFADRANMTMGLSQGPGAVAKVTLAALGRQVTVRPGWLSKLIEISLVPLPRGGRTRIMQQVMAGMTKKERR